VEKNDELRTQFIETVESYPQYKLYFIDECGIDRYMYREYAYSPKGSIVRGNISGKKYKRTNVIAAKCCDRIVAPMLYEGSTDCVLFEHWFEWMLLKSIPKHSVLIMDNAAFHRKSKLLQIAANAECDVLFLPPYSPDLNPIEHFWAWLKCKLRDILHLYSNFDDALIDCFQLN